MKMTTKERKALEMLRELEPKQRADILGQMERAVLANRITLKVSGARKLKLATNKRIERTYGLPRWKKRRPGQ